MVGHARFMRLSLSLPFACTAPALTMHQLTILPPRLRAVDPHHFRHERPAEERRAVVDNRPRAALEFLRRSEVPVVNKCRPTRQGEFSRRLAIPGCEPHGASRHVKTFHHAAERERTVCAEAVVVENNTRPSTAGPNLIAFKVFIFLVFLSASSVEEDNGRRALDRVINGRRCRRIRRACILHRWQGRA